MKSIVFSFLLITAFSLSALATKNNCGNNIDDLKHGKSSAFPKLGLTKFRDITTPEIIAYIAEQNQRATEYVTGSPIFVQLENRIKEYAPTNLPLITTTQKGELFIKAGSLIYKTISGEEKILAPKIVYPNDNGSSSIAEFKVSPDESKVLYSYIENGKDLNHWYVADLDTGKVIAGPMDVRLSDANWSLNSETVYYTKWATYDEIKKGIYYAHNYSHDLRTGKETLVFKPPQKDSHEFYAIDDFWDQNGNKKLIAYRSQGTAEIPLGLYFGEMGQSGQYDWKPIRISKKHRLGKYLTTHEGKIILRTTERGGNFGLVSVDPETMETKTLVRSTPKEVMFLAQRMGKYIFTQYYNQENLTYSLKVFGLDGKLAKSWEMGDLEVPAIGLFSAFQGSRTSEWVYFNYSSAITAPETFRVNLTKMEIEKLPSSPIDFDPQLVSVGTEKIKTTAGSIVPIETYKRKDGTKPLFNYVFSYGYIGIIQPGWWNQFIQATLELGGMVTVAHITGGGEGGRDGQLDVKARRLQTVKELESVAKHNRATEGVVQYQVISGRSFGGLQTLMNLVKGSGVFDFYSPIVPVTDINEFFNLTPFGPFALDDFGANRNSMGQVADTDAFRKNISTFSPLQNLDELKSIKPIMTFVSHDDERVTPSQGLAATYALQAKFPGYPYIYVYTTKNAGHFARSEAAYQMAFIARQLGIKELKPLRRK